MLYYIVGIIYSEPSFSFKTNIMKSIKFPEVTNKVAEKQDEFQTLEAQFNPAERSINVCFEFTKKEMAEFQKTGVLWYKQIIAQGHRMHPMKISPFKHDIITHNPEIIVDGKK